MTVEFSKRWSITQVGRERSCTGKCGEKTLGRFIRPDGEKVVMCRSCALTRVSREAVKQIIEERGR